jgi:hypothetical protein
MKNTSHPYHKLRVALFELGAFLHFGCSDGNCKITGPRHGMHTNGGCRCIESLSDLALNVAAEADKVKRIHCGPLAEIESKRVMP